MTARRLVGPAVALIIAVILLPRLAPVRTLVITAALVPEVIRLGPAPLSLATTEPTRTTTNYGLPADRMDVYLPSGASTSSRVPAVLLALGVHPQAIDHPDIAGFATAIARAGVVVGIPDSTDLRNLRVTPAEAGHLADAFLTLSSRSEVDPQRVGLAGFSAGASIALMAAADPRIVGSVRYVAAFGGYAGAERLLVDVATRSSEMGSQVVSWQPDAGIRHDVLELALAALTAESERAGLRELLAPVVAADQPPNGPDPEAFANLDGDAQALYALFTASNRVRAEAAIALLSAEMRQHLAGISPVTTAQAVRAPVFLLHGAPDTAIPVAHVALLRDAIGDEVQRATIFGRFGHEQPGARGLGLDDATDIWELSLYLRDVVAATIE